MNFRRPEELWKLSQNSLDKVYQLCLLHQHIQLKLNLTRSDDHAQIISLNREFVKWRKGFLGPPKYKIVM